MRLPTALLLTLSLLLVPAAAQTAPPPASRMQLAVLLWESAGGVPYDANGPFSDVTRDEDGATAVAWCFAADLLLGTGDGCFSPHRPVTREELAAVLRRYAARLGRDTFLPDGAAACNEYEDISPWADDSLYWACDAGALSWSPGGRLDPYGTLSLPQLQAVLEAFFAAPVPSARPSLTIRFTS